MKKLLLLTLFLTCIVTINSSAQEADSIFIHQTNGTVLSLSISEIDSITFTTVPLETVADIDGNEYEIVTIGEQDWIRQNLRTTRLNDGTPLELITDDDEWANTSLAAYSYFDNDSATNAVVFGALYNGEAVSSGNLCPTGFHVPSQMEWEELESFVGSQGFNNNESTALRATFSYFINQGTDNFFFTATAAGFREEGNGRFNGAGTATDFYTTTQASSTETIVISLRDFTNLINTNSTRTFDFGGSVRCLRD